MGKFYSVELKLVNEYRKEAPVNVKALAQALGLDVRFTSMEKEMSGRLLHNAPDRYVIEVNANHPETRQRFTIAHELGHYMLHRGIIEDGVNDSRAYRTMSGTPYYNSKIGVNEETEANRFAANVLMPYELIEQLQKEGLAEAQKLAARLNVSKRAMEIRLDGINRYRPMEQNMMRQGL